MLSLHVPMVHGSGQISASLAHQDKNSILVSSIVRGRYLTFFAGLFIFRSIVTFLQGYDLVKNSLPAFIIGRVPFLAPLTATVNSLFERHLFGWFPLIADVADWPCPVIFTSHSV